MYKHKLDWSVIDPLIIEHLPNMTCVDFSKKFPYTSAKVISDWEVVE